MGKFDRYMMKGGKQLRCGYTTGSCAAAAAKGAAALLLTGKIPSALQLETPAGIFLALEPRNAKTDGLTASCEVIKDAGDDPDVTDGILIGCRVRKTTGAVSYTHLDVYKRQPSLSPGPVNSRELWVRLPPDLCMLTAAISAPASMADIGNPSPK